MIVIRGGEVLTDRGWIAADLSVDGGRIDTIGPNAHGDVVIEASGCWVGPGFVDMHAHLREPGQTWKEDIASGSAAAAAGGFTAVTAMPNTDPPLDSPAMIERVRARAAEVGLTEVVVAAAVSRDRAGRSLSDLEGLYRAGVTVFSDDGDPVDAHLMGEALNTLASLPGAILAQHAEDPTMTVGGHMHEGKVSRALGVGGLAAEAETEVVRRDLELVARSGARYHCQHVSARMTVDLIRSAKRSELAISAEVTPHHLIFDHEDLSSLDTDFKMYPPLRAPEDREALVAGLREGTIDVIATDHAPHLPEEKAVEFEAAPRGVIGLETAASAAWEALGDRDLVFSALSTSPAGLLGLEDQGRPVAEGRVANLVVFDPSATWVPNGFASKSSNSPFLGREMSGVVRATLLRGRITHLSPVVIA
ncbi:MAG TPA: dihydroorotase [Acidimicrobiia bacterium]|nr:dihydroorotase [Acidimicrobiia bacterium]